MIINYRSRSLWSLLMCSIIQNSVFILLLIFLMQLPLTSYSVTPPIDQIGNLPNFNPVTGEMEDLEFRVAIEPNKVDCFYQDAKKDHNLEINYQVVEMSSRFQWMYSPNSAQDLIIDFYVNDPRGKTIMQEQRKTEGSHVEAVKEDGVYTICFDNRLSASSKLVNVEVYLYSSDDDDRWGYMQDTLTFPPEIQYLDTVESIKVSINRVRDDLTKVVHSQDERRAIERRDRILVENNLKYINRFSLFSTFLMIVVGIGQIFIIRDLFEEKSHLKKIFKHF